MNYWLMKSEPETWSWEQQVKAGSKGEGWDGVRNYQASNNMRSMKKYDRALPSNDSDPQPIVLSTSSCPGQLAQS